ncbi:MAG: glucose-1-phosphate adenylyltransferase, partial [Oscillospiraceae bacterium]|nr:glucose-1-phosphate adenylyltransferase [Oscillospiraceae bacterium]
YKGTANAIYQNIDFIDRYDPDYVVILSGDHIYKMDYADMVAYHEKNQASCTIAVRNVPLEEASRFGILNTNPDNSIYEFEEKPKKPKSTNASMGIYVFNWKVLREALIADEEDPASSNDFGKNIIPGLLNAGHKMMAYTFDGYWKDVGTIDSLWEANMELLGKDPEFNIRGDERRRIYARNSALPSSYIDEDAEICNSFVAEGSEVYGTVRHSVISVGCSIGEDAVVEDSVVMPGVVIESGAIVRHAILGENSRICRNAVVGGAYGKDEKKQISVTSKGAVVEENTVLAPGDML